jgi:hypothetical protein
MVVLDPLLVCFMESQLLPRCMVSGQVKFVRSRGMLTVCLHFANLTGAGSSYQHMGSEPDLRLKDGCVWALVGVYCKMIVSTTSCI